MSGINNNNQRFVHSTVDWRKSRPGRKAKLSYILDTDLFSDITFCIGAEKVSMFGHKFVLSLYSTVFEAMFRGPLAIEGEEMIDLPDIEPNAFRSLLKFVYTGEFDNEILTQDALGVLYAAKKYDITDLEAECISFLKSRISEDNGVSIFQTAQFLDEIDLRDEVQGFLIRNFDNIMKAEDFLNMSRENLCLFLESDDTRGCELDLFHGVLKWAVAECSRQEIPQTPENHRVVLKEALTLVRFPVMTSEDIALQVVPTGVLSPEECTLLFQHLVVSPDNRSLLPQIPFNSKKRNCSIYTAKFYDEVARTAYVDISAGWYNKFSVDQSVSVVSFGFYGPHNVDVATYDVHIKLLKDSSDSVFAEAKQTLMVKMKEVFHVKFPKAVPINPSISYRAWFSLKGPLTCHGTTTIPIQEVTIPVNGSRFRQVKFFYTVTGAHQLPEMLEVEWDAEYLADEQQRHSSTTINCAMLLRMLKVY